MKKSVRLRIFALVLFVIAFIFGCGLFSTLGTAEAATVTGLSGSGDTWFKVASNTVYGNISDFEYGCLSDGVLSNGIYYTNKASITASFYGVGNDFVHLKDSYNSKWTRYGKISAGGNSVEVGDAASTSSIFAVKWAKNNFEEINKLSLSVAVNETISTTVTFQLQQYSTKDTHYRHDNYTFNAEVKRDVTKPTISSSVTNGGYTKSGFTITAKDSGSGINKIYIKTPGSNTFSVENGSSNASVTKTYSSPSNGTYEFYTVDMVGFESDHYFINYDNIKPTNKIKDGNNNLLGGFTNNAFKYVPEDTNQIVSCAIKRPGGDWGSYTANTLIAKNAGDGLYQFSCTDVAGNVSDIVSITLDTVAPGLTMQNKNGVVVDGAIINELPYFYTDDDTNNTISFYRKNGDKYDLMPVWEGYKNNTIYYYARDLIGISTPYDQSKIFYDRQQALNYIISHESSAAHLTSAFNWTSTVAGKIIENEKPYSKVGAQYWIYTALENGNDVRYIFFSEARAKTYISTNAGNYLKSNSQHLFYEETTVKVVARDRAGNETSRIFTLDMNKPIGAIQGNSAEGYANGSFTYQATDSQTPIANVYWRVNSGGWKEEAMSFFVVTPGNDVPEGRYEFYAVDQAGNKSDTISIILDSKAPEFSLSEFYRANQTISLSITESYLDRVTLDGTVTTSRSWSASTLNEGVHTVAVYDKAGNSTSRTFTIDKTPPEFSMNEFYRANQSISASITESHLDHAEFDGQQLSVVGQRINIAINDSISEGRHTVVVYDKAGNSTSHTFTVDKTAPKFTLNEFYRADQTVSLSITESYLDRVTLDGSVTALRSWNTSKDLPEGVHTIVVYDKAGNSTSHMFTVDRTAPKFTLNEFYRANQTVSLSITESYLDRIELRFGYTVLYNGAARSWNTNELDEGTYSLIVHDKAGNSATGTFTVDKTAPKFSLNNFYRAGQRVQLKITENNLDTVYFDGKPTTETQWDDLYEGTHTVSVCDKAGNITNTYFIVDKTPPKFSLDAYYAANETVELSITEAYLDYVTLDGNVDSRRSISAATLNDGQHSVSAYDRAGNVTTVTFIVDKTAPIFELKEFYAANETVDLILTEANLDYVTLDGVQVSARSWNADSISEGEHTVVVYDKAGNSTSRTFFFKTSSPSLSLQRNDASAANGVHVKAGDRIAVVINDGQFDHLTFDGKRLDVADLDEIGANNWKKVWEADSLEQGTHTIVTFDKAGNETSVAFVVDTTLPTLVFRVNGVPKQSGVFLKGSDNLNFSASDINLDRVLLDGETTTVFQYSASALSEICHTITVYDKAGNHISFAFTVDRTAPDFFLEEFYRDGQLIALSVTEVNLENVSFDGEPTETLTWDTAMLDEGRHTVTVKDLAGNVTTRTFTVDKTLPSFSLKDYYRAGDVIMLSIEESYLNYVTLNGSVTTVRSWTATNLPNGTHTVIAYDRAGNSTSRTFTVDTIAPYLEVVKNNVIEDSPYFSASDLIAIVVEDDNFDELSLNSTTTQAENVLISTLDDGVYTLKAIDKAGNETVRIFTVDKTAPNLTLRRNGTPVEPGTFFRAGQTVSLLIVESNRQDVELDDAITEQTSWRAEDLYEGQHTVRITDKAGNVSSLVFSVDITAPEFSLNSFYGRGMSIEVSEDFDANFDRVELQFGYSALYAGEARSWSTDELDEGSYSLTVYDKAGNATSQSFTVDKTAPEFSLNEFYRASDYIRLIISENNLDYVMLDGVIESASILSCANLSEGAHNVTAFDRAGNSMSVDFIVDKTDPVIELREFYAGGETVFFEIQDTYPGKVLLDGREYAEGFISTDKLDEGRHTVTATDLAGNTAQFFIVVDKTDPEFSLNEFYRETDTIFLSIREGNLDYVTLDDGVTELTTWQCTQLSEGSHTIVVYDKAGNMKRVDFVIDKTPPDVTVYVDDNRSDDGAYYPESALIRIEIRDENFSHMTLNYNDFDARTFSIASLDDDVYTLRIFDKAGNVTVRTFTVDKTPPAVTLRRNMTSVPLKGAYFSAYDTVSIVISDKNAMTWYMDSAETILTSWRGSDLSDGLHTIEAYDAAGNVTTVTFTVQKTLPDLELKDYYVAGETVDISLFLSEATLERVELDGGITYLTGWTVEDLGDGAHTLTVYDKAGNSVMKNFVVDTTPPSLEVFRNSIAATDPIFIKAGDMFSINVYDDNLDRVEFDDEPTDARTWLAAALDERLHTVVVYDKAGNTASRSFTVDKTAPAITLKRYYLRDEVVPFTAEELNFDHAELNGTRIFLESETSERLGEGIFTLCIYDKADNVTTVDFIVDLSAPVITIDGISASGEPCAIFENSTSYGKTVAQATDIADFTIYALRDGSESPLSSDSSIDLEEEGTWEIWAIDENGYESEHGTFHLDGSAPRIEVEADADEGAKGYTNGAFTITVSDTFPASLYVSFDEGDFELVAGLSFQVPADVSHEGIYDFYAVDEGGLCSDLRRVILDIGAPDITLDGVATLNASVAYTNTTFTLRVSDTHFAAIFYRKMGGAWQETALNSCEIENTRENEGVWELYATDTFSQRSATYTVTLSFTFDFQNIADMTNEYKVNTWYTVSLPAKIYAATSKPDISGNYTFENATDALNWAIQCEKDYRVTALPDGGYSYVSVSNEAVFVTYSTEAELNEALSFYARKYVSDRKIFNNNANRNSYPNLMTPAGVLDPSALTRNAMAAPEWLQAEYSHLPVILANQTFVPSAHAALSPVSASLCYLGNLIGAVTPTPIAVNYGESLYAALSAAGNLYEGYYLFEEKDLAGNVEQAIIFIDLSAPTLSAHIERGDGSEDLTVTQDVVGERSGVFYALSFSLNAFFDNVDADFVSVSIVSDRYAETFTVGDELPVLDADLGAGRYTVTVYDRSHNALTFTVIIAGTEPGWYYTSLSASNAKLTIYLTKNDSNIAFISLRLIKIHSDGTYFDLETDSEGTPISTATTAYVLTEGGKYTAIIVDIYGRTTEMAPIFYERGLPSGTLNGVNNGGVTKGSVIFTYADDYDLSVFFASPAGRVPNLGVTPVYDTIHRTYTATFEPVDNSHLSFILVLYSKADEGIFIEYTFDIDREVPLFSITSADGTPVAQNGDTNQPFRVDWGEDGVVAKYSREGFAMQTYTKGTLLRINTLYTFVISDRVGNDVTFTVYVDSEVHWHFSANSVVVGDNAFLSKNPGAIFVDEEYVTFELIDANGTVFQHGEELSAEGIYSFLIVDRYGNRLDGSVTLDFTAPAITLNETNDRFLFNEDVTLLCDDVSATLEIVDRNGKTLEEIESKRIFREEGSYTVRATDPAGNIAMITFTVDKHVDYAANVVSGLYTTSAVTVTFGEVVTQRITLDGEESEPYNRYTAPGAYVIALSDAAGNETALSFTILPLVVRQLHFELGAGLNATSITRGGEQAGNVPSASVDLTESGVYSITIYDASTSRSFSFDVTLDSSVPTLDVIEKTGEVSFENLSKASVTAVLYKDGALINDNFNLKSKVTEKGRYVLILTDDVGNTAQYEFVVKTTLNAFSIILIVVGGVVLIVVVVLIIKGRRFKAA